MALRDMFKQYKKVGAMAANVGVTKAEQEDAFTSSLESKPALRIDTNSDINDTNIGNTTDIANAANIDDTDNTANDVNAVNDVDINNAANIDNDTNDVSDADSNNTADTDNANNDVSDADSNNTADTADTADTDYEDSGFDFSQLDIEDSGIHFDDNYDDINNDVNIYEADGDISDKCTDRSSEGYSENHGVEPDEEDVTDLFDNYDDIGSIDMHIPDEIVNSASSGVALNETSENAENGDTNDAKSMGSNADKNEAEMENVGISDNFSDQGSKDDVGSSYSDKVIKRLDNDDNIVDTEREDIENFIKEKASAKSVPDMIPNDLKDKIQSDVSTILEQSDNTDETVDTTEPAAISEARGEVCAFPRETMTEKFSNMPISERKDYLINLISDFEELMLYLKEFITKVDNKCELLDKAVAELYSKIATCKISDAGDIVSKIQEYTKMSTDLKDLGDYIKAELSD